MPLRRKNTRRRLRGFTTMDEKKERQKEIERRLEEAGIDPSELDESEQEELADLL